MNRLKLLFVALSLNGFVHAQTADLKIKSIDGDKNGIALFQASLIDADRDTVANQDGIALLSNIPYGSYQLEVLSPGYQPYTTTVNVNEEEQDLTVTLASDTILNLDNVEIFGERNDKPKGLEMITRLPINPNDNIQTVSVISYKVIEAQGALTITDAVRNIPGVTLFGSYGGVKESMSTRGFRGVPVLKNGIRMDSQFQTASGVVDMQGVESIQMIKGSAAITQGVITDIGNAGGVINVVTKTPNFTNLGNVSLRYGSWHQVRPSFDIQRVLTQKKNIGIRFNGVYEYGKTFREGTSAHRFYFNPSFAWKVSEKTSFIIEGDYFNDNRTPKNDAINLAPGQGENALYIIPKDKFLGFNTDNNNTKMSSFMARFDHNINDKLMIRAAYGFSSYQVDNISTTSNAAFKNKDFNLRKRDVTKSLRDDKNSTLQFDFIAQNIKTGPFKHTIQTGFDYRSANATTTSFDAVTIDTIDIYGDFTNDLSKVVKYDDMGNEKLGVNIVFNPKTPVVSAYHTFGILAQDIIELHKYLKLFIGVRYSEIYTKDPLGTKGKRQSAWNPSVGLMLSPTESINIFGSYTNSTSLRSASNLMSNGQEIGSSRTQQFEAGIKTAWFKDRLRYNLTYFHIYTANLSNSEYLEGTNVTTGYYFKAGDLLRDGIETELNGRITKDLTVMVGYAFLKARYKNSPSYVNGSAPMNAPTHTANGWIQYQFSQGALRGLSLSAGVYYVGKRPVNEYSLTPDGHGNMGGEKPFDMPAYTTLNAQIGYTYKAFSARLYMNNLTNKIGLNSYFRGGYINQTEPINASLSISYKF